MKKLQFGAGLIMVSVSLIGFGFGSTWWPPLATPRVSASETLGNQAALPPPDSAGAILRRSRDYRRPAFSRWSVSGLSKTPGGGDECLG